MPTVRTSPRSTSARKAPSDHLVSCVHSPALDDGAFARQYHVKPVASIASTADRGSAVKSGTSYAIGPFSRK